MDHNVANLKENQLIEVKEFCKCQKEGSIVSQNSVRLTESCSSHTITTSILTATGDFFTTGLANEICDPFLVVHTKRELVGEARPAMEHTQARPLHTSSTAAFYLEVSVKCCWYMYSVNGNSLLERPPCHTALPRLSIA